MRLFLLHDISSSLIFKVFQAFDMAFALNFQLLSQIEDPRYVSDKKIDQLIFNYIEGVRQYWLQGETFR